MKPAARTPRYRRPVLRICGRIGRARLTPGPLPITLVVGSSPGSLADAAAQLLGAQLASAGYEVEYQNMPGDLGLDASRYVVQSLSRPDIMLVT